MSGPTYDLTIYGTRATYAGYTGKHRTVEAADAALRGMGYERVTPWRPGIPGSTATAEVQPIES